MRTIEWKDGAVVTIDQTKLPHRLVHIELGNCKDVASAIQAMKIRGAPLIGAAAAYGLALTAIHSKASTKEEFLGQIQHSAQQLKDTRPTGVNLFWAVDRVLDKIKEASNESVESLRTLVLTEAQEIADEDVEMNQEMGKHGSKLMADGDTVLTHCNAGALATVGYGTALGIIQTAWNQGKKISVIVTETRPKLQGARLTAFELKSAGIPFTLITDNMVGYVMSMRKVDKVVVGADRVVRDGIVNKIGTYSIAVLAHEHKVPFYPAAPSSSFDLTHTVKDVIIEERKPEEVTRMGLKTIAPHGTKALNPAFDITPMKYVTAVICEKGVFTPKQLARARRQLWQTRVTSSSL